MIIVKPSVVLLSVTGHALDLIERAGRTCYQSSSGGNTDAFVKGIMDKGHHSVIEHASATFRIVCDRGVTHEIVRHRLASYSQESTRYCNYAKEKFGQEIQVIVPPHLSPGDRIIWEQSVKAAEYAYMSLIMRNVTPQIARSVLPNCLKTEIVMTANFREWLHFIKLRTASAAHPQMREIAGMIQSELLALCPTVFNLD